jgi:hypothetical protein
MINLYRQIDNINRVAIDLFFAASLSRANEAQLLESTDKKCLRLIVTSAVK